LWRNVQKCQHRFRWIFRTKIRQSRHV